MQLQDGAVTNQIAVFVAVGEKYNTTLFTLH